MILQESHKLSLLDSRLDVYTLVLQHVTEVAFNEIQLATDHTSKNEPNVKRAIVTFKQAKMLVGAVSLDETPKKKAGPRQFNNAPLGQITPMLPNAGCLSEWHGGGREETVSHAERAYQIIGSQLARSSCGTPYSALARIYARTYENIAKNSASTLTTTHPCCTI